MEIDICRDCVTHELIFGDFMDTQQKFLIFLSVKMNLRDTLKMDATKFCINPLMHNVAKWSDTRYCKQSSAKSTDAFSFLKALERQKFLFIQALKFSFSPKTNTNIKSKSMQNYSN